MKSILVIWILFLILFVNIISKSSKITKKSNEEALSKKSNKKVLSKNQKSTNDESSQSNESGTPTKPHKS